MGNGTVLAPTFEGILVNMGVRLVPKFADICSAFAGTLDETVNYELLLGFMIGIMSDYRLQTVRRAFRKLLQAGRGGVVTVETILDLWNPRCFPGVTAGTL